jgi:hypothetical protein
VSDEAVRVRDAQSGPGADDALPEVIVIGEARLDGEVLARRDPRLRAWAADGVRIEAQAGLPADAAIGAPLYEAVAVLLAHVLAVDAKTREQ